MSSFPVGSDVSYSVPARLAGETRGSASVATCPGPPEGRAGGSAEPHAEELLQRRTAGGRGRNDVGQGLGVGDDGEVAFGVPRIVVDGPVHPVAVLLTAYSSVTLAWTRP